MTTAIPVPIYPASGGGASVLPVGFVFGDPISATWLGILGGVVPAGTTCVIYLTDDGDPITRGFYTGTGSELVLTSALFDGGHLGEFISTTVQSGLPDAVNPMGIPVPGGAVFVVVADDEQPPLAALERVASEGRNVAGQINMFGPARSAIQNLTVVADISGFSPPPNGGAATLGCPGVVTHVYIQDGTGIWTLASDAGTDGTAEILWADGVPTLAVGAGHATVVRYTQLSNTQWLGELVAADIAT